MGAFKELEIEKMNNKEIKNSDYTFFILLFSAFYLIQFLYSIVFN